MRCRFDVAERTVGKPQGLVYSTEHPQRDGILYLRYPGIIPEPVGEIGMALRVVERDSLSKMFVGASKVAEIKAGVAKVAMRDHSLGTIRPGRGFVQEQLDYFAHRRGFAAIKMPDPNTVIGREPFRGVFFSARQFTGARKGGTRFRRLIPF